MTPPSTGHYMRTPSPGVTYLLSHCQLAPQRFLRRASAFVGYRDLCQAGRSAVASVCERHGGKGSTPVWNRTNPIHLNNRCHSSDRLSQSNGRTGRQAGRQTGRPRQEKANEKGIKSSGKKIKIKSEPELSADSRSMLALVTFRLHAGYSACMRATYASFAAARRPTDRSGDPPLPRASA